MHRNQRTLHSINLLTSSDSSAQSVCPRDFFLPDLNLKDSMSQHPTCTQKKTHAHWFLSYNLLFSRCPGSSMNFKWTSVSCLSMKTLPVLKYDHVKREAHTHKQSLPSQQVEESWREETGCRFETGRANWHWGALLNCSALTCPSTNSLCLPYTPRNRCQVQERRQNRVEKAVPFPLLSLHLMHACIPDGIKLQVGKRY